MLHLKKSTSIYSQWQSQKLLKGQAVYCRRWETNTYGHRRRNRGDTGDMYHISRWGGQAMYLSPSHTHSCKYILVSQHKKRERGGGNLAAHNARKPFGGPAGGAYSTPPDPVAGGAAPSPKTLPLLSALRASGFSPFGLASLSPTPKLVPTPLRMESRGHVYVSWYERWLADV